MRISNTAAVSMAVLAIGLLSALCRWPSLAMLFHICLQQLSQTNVEMAGGGGDSHVTDDDMDLTTSHL